MDRIVGIRSACGKPECTWAECVVDLTKWNIATIFFAYSNITFIGGNQHKWI